MSYKRIIPCLDIKGGKTVKGVNFINIKEVGDPLDMAVRYQEDGADELVFLDITATIEGRKTFIDLIRRISPHISIPFTVGGGISTVEGAGELLEAGASKVSVNSAAVKNPQLINDLAHHFGSNRITAAIDARLNGSDNDWIVLINGGGTDTDKRLFSWAKETEERGAGEILFTSMSHDGVKNGYPNDALAELKNWVSVAVIASGGAGNMEHFKEALTIGRCDAALAASIFHFGEVTVPALKRYLKENNINVK